jgi:hypothetical protein
MAASLQGFGHNETLSSVSTLTATTSVGTTPSTGNVLAVVEYAASGSVSSVVDSNGNAFTASGAEVHNTSDGPFYQGYILTNKNLSGTYSVTANLSSSQFCQVSFAAISGGSTSGVLAQALVNAYLTTSSPFSNPITASANGNLIVGFISTVAPGADTFTAASGFSIYGSASVAQLSCAWAAATGVTTSGTSYNPNLSDAAAQNYSKAVVFTFEVAATAGNGAAIAWVT